MNTAMESQLAAAGVFATAGTSAQATEESTAAPAMIPLTAGPAQPAPEDRCPVRGEPKKNSASDSPPVIFIRWRGAKKE